MSNLNPVELFNTIKERTRGAITAHFPYVGKLHRLELVSLDIQDDEEKPSSKFHVDNIQSQYDTKVVGGTWAVPVKARLRLVDIETGKALDEATITIARLPKITRRYSYIIDGHERQHDMTFRLKARPYHIITGRGEPAARWNLSVGHGFDLKIPQGTKKIQMKFGTANVPLYPLLRVLGVPDVSIEQAWGKEIFAANRTGDVSELWKIHRRLTSKDDRRYKVPPPEELAKYLRDYFTATKVRPDAMEAAFGIPFDHVSGESLLLSSKRLIGIQKGVEPEDDRTSLSAKDIVGTEDYVLEYLEKRTKDLHRKVMNNLDKKDKVSDILAANTYTKVIKSAFEYAQRPEQTNPLTFVVGHMRTTIRGELGGVKGDHTNMDADRLINPSHLGFLDPIATPEAEDAGIALHLGMGVKKDGKELKIKVYDVQQKKIIEATPGLLEHAVVAYPDQVEWKGGVPTPRGADVVVYDAARQTTKRPWKEVRYVILSTKGLFTFSTNLIPFLQNNQGNRAMMAAKQMEQAVALTHREAPLVQAKSEGNLSFEQALGHLTAHLSPTEGTVSKVGKDHIQVTTADGKVAKVSMYDHFPLNGGKTMLHSEAVVEVGDKVKKGQVLADTNYSRNGTLALGTNLRVAYIPYAGLNFEDGVVISESASKKLSSPHLHVESLYQFPGVILNRKRWVDSALPEKATSARIGKLDDDGIIREGQSVNPGDILVAALSPAQPTKEEQALGTIHKSLVRSLKDSAVVWDHDYPGKVVKIIRTPERVVVHVRTEEPMSIGDKLSGRYGDKGIISRILKDHEMPHDAQGEPVHVLLNPAGVVSRMNVGQVLETAASKIAKKTGKPYLTDNFAHGVDFSQKVEDELEAHGLTDTEELFDSKTGKSLGQILVGDKYLLKLHHQVDKKMTARSHGGAYTPNGAAPSGSGIPGGGQKADQLMTYAMLAHGASHNLREMFTFKSDSDQSEVWSALQTGRPLPPPRPARVMQNFLTYMKGMGTHVEKKGDEYLMSPMTDKQTLAISNGIAKFPDKLLKAKGGLTMEEVGGLFDPKITGGLTGPYWSHLELAERIPNPMFEEPIRVLLGMKKKEFNDLIGPDLVHGKSGFITINDRLKNLDVQAELKKSEKELVKAKGPQLQAAYRKVRYLRALEELKITPLDAYTNKVLPIVPPAVRRVSIGLDGRQQFDDLNGLYTAVGMINQQLKKADPATPESSLQRQRAALYEAVSALRINGMDMMEGAKKRHHRGLMETLKGDSPKQSFYHSYVMKRRQDLSGRSTIIPLPELGLDELGLPVPIAMEMYKPFVVRELHTQRGYTPLQAQDLVKKKDPIAMEALNKVVQDHPVLFKRDPALHKFSIMAFNPRLIPGKAIGVHPLVTGGFNADFDGDAMALYLPVSREAIDEAKGMLPSKNLFSSTHGGLMNVPAQDSLLGLYQISAWGKAAKVVPATVEQAATMLHDGKVHVSDVISVGGKPSTIGRWVLSKDLPEGISAEKLLHDPTFRLSGAGLRTILLEVAHKSPNSYAILVDHWKDWGNKLSYLHGSSFSIQDFHDGKELRDEILKPLQKEEAEIRASNRTHAQKDADIIKLYTSAIPEVERRGTARYSAGNNRVYEWSASGAGKGWLQFGQVVMGPLVVQGPKGDAVPVPITKSFGEGLPLSEYWASMHGARKGALDRALGTSEPGAMTKDIVNTMMNVQISGEDCHTTHGSAMQVDEPDVEGRFLVEAVAHPPTLAGTLLTPPLLAAMRKGGTKQVIVRTPLHCKAAHGICARCYGHSEFNKLHHVGTNIGVIAGQALGEPVTQLAMKTRHTGGAVSGAGLFDAFKRVKQLFKLPKNLPNAAVLVTHAGTVQKVTKDTALGGQNIYVDNVRHYVPAQQTLLDHVRAGTEVKKGETLSSGFVDPHELLKLTNNVHAVRSYLTNEISKTYGAKTIRRRNIETVVRAMTNLTQIESAPDHHEYTRGALMPLSEIEAANSTATAEGKVKIHHKPILKAMSEMPLAMQEDWLARLNYNKLETTYREGGAQAWRSDIHGSLVPGLAHGAEFGTKPVKKGTLK